MNVAIIQYVMDHWAPIAQLSADEYRSLQNKKLHHFINAYLYPFSPHYRRLFDQHKIDPRNIRSAADLKDIPFSSKKDFTDFPKNTNKEVSTGLRENSNAEACINPEQPDRVKDFILQPDLEKIRKHWPIDKLLTLKAQALLKGKDFVKDRLGEEFRPCFITFTTGTTNMPVSFLYSKYDIQNLYTSGSRMISLFGIRPEEKIVSMFPYAPHLAIWQVVFGGLSSGVLILSTGGGKVMGTKGNISILKKVKPSVILGVPSYVYHVLRVAKEDGEQLSSIQKVILGASKITTAFKLKLVDLLASLGATNVSIFGTYGFTEARCAWAECPTANDVSSGYFLYPDKEIFEVIDPQTGEVKKEGEDGELVYTGIDARGSCVLRYRTGDFVKGGIIYEPSPYSSLKVPRISSDIIRLSDTQDLHFSKVKGSLVNFGNFEVLFSEFADVVEWQIELCKKDNDPFEVDQMIVYVACKSGVNIKKLEETIKEQLLVATEVSANEVCFIPLDEMVRRLELDTANKEKRIIDRRPHA